MAQLQYKKRKGYTGQEDLVPPKALLISTWGLSRSTIPHGFDFTPGHSTPKESYLLYLTFRTKGHTWPHRHECAFRHGGWTMSCSCVLLPYHPSLSCPHLTPLHHPHSGQPGEWEKGNWRRVSALVLMNCEFLLAWQTGSRGNSLSLSMKPT
jgi:hypothetical protein